MLFSIKNTIKQRQRQQGYKLLIRNLQIPLGAKIAITGPSGCGKSTTLDILGLSLKPDSADQFIFTPGRQTKYNIQSLWQENRQDSLTLLRLNHMGYVLQSGELLPFLSAGENMLLTAKLAGIDDKIAEEDGRKLAASLGIEHLWNSAPATLSVGERQRVAITRAMTSRPQVILADEPTAALDPLHAAKVMDAFLDCLSSFGATLILATHNAQWAKAGGLTEYSFKLVEDEHGVTAILDDGS